MRIIIAGPPHSGKSIAENFLRHQLPLQQTMRVAAQPDGEGDWTQVCYATDMELAAQLRKKGKFSSKFVDWAVQAVRNCTSRFCLVDVGGIISDENRQICREADAMIIVSSDSEKAIEWAEFAKSLNLRVLALLHSTLDSQTEWFHRVQGQIWETEGLVVGLDRETFKSSRTLRNVAEDLIKNFKEEKKMEKKMNALTIKAIAALIGKSEENYEIRGGRKVHGLNWKTEELSAVYQALQPFAMVGSNWLIDGRAPQFLVSNIVHALHPCSVSLADTKVEQGFVTIGERKDPKGKKGSGELPFNTTENFQGGTLVEYARDQFTIIDYHELDRVVPPEVDRSRAVFLSGKTANWATVEIAMTYAHIVPAIYLYQPGVGFICVISHSPSHQLGAVIDARPPVAAVATQ